MSKKLKDKLEDGNGTMLISFFILLVSLLISIICIEMGNLLTNKSKTQVWADAAANTIAAYSATQGGFDEGMAQEMYHKMNTYMHTYGKLNDSSMDITVANRLITTKVSYTTPVIYGVTANHRSSVYNLTAEAEVEFVDSMEGWTDPLEMFPINPTERIHPIITMSRGYFSSNTYLTYLSFLRQFYIEDRSRYNYAGTKNTCYGYPMEASELLLNDIAFSCNVDLNEIVHVFLPETVDLNTTEYFSVGFMYIVEYQGKRYVAYGASGDMAKIIYCNPDGRGSGNTTLSMIPINEITFIWRSPERLYTSDALRNFDFTFGTEYDHYN